MINNIQKFSQREKISQEKRHWVRLTRVCNNNCVFCLDKEAQDGTVVSSGDIKRDLEKGVKEKAKRVILSGGEPTIHPQFIKIVKLAKDLGYQHIQVISNGRMFAYKNFLDEATKAGINEITFSLHGHNPKLHDVQTQIKGSFKESLSGLINTIRSKKVIVSVDVVINKYNYKYLFEILNFYIGLGVNEFDLLQITPFGSAWDNRDRVLYDIKQALPYLQKAFKLSKNPNINIWTNRFPAKYLEGFENLIQSPVKLHEEVRGREVTFEQFLKNGTKMQCYGEKCQYCFLKDFCSDLIELKVNGRLNETITFCRSNNLLDSLINSSSLKLDEIYSYNKINFFKFINFFIDNRYFVKSQFCQKCKLEKYCSGININNIRKGGFSKEINFKTRFSYPEDKILPPKFSLKEISKRIEKTLNFFIHHISPAGRHGNKYLVKTQDSKNFYIYFYRSQEDQEREYDVLEKLSFKGVLVPKVIKSGEIKLKDKIIFFNLVTALRLSLAKWLDKNLSKSEIKKLGINFYQSIKKVHRITTESREKFDAWGNAIIRNLTRVDIPYLDYLKKFEKPIKLSLIHNDLSLENLFVDNLGLGIGFIDWSDYPRYGDPLQDFVFIYQKMILLPFEGINSRLKGINSRQVKNVHILYKFLWGKYCKENKINFYNFLIYYLYFLSRHYPPKWCHRAPYRFLQNHYHSLVKRGRLI